ncbi:tetraacyldisaccharide 4'-kinase [Halonatronum saccharophilum]|uniref:tetraacyldisaccharide 4'-kinase n=1 Tax=Halonatronum saccharophilum TaxID=150060 RepID=UPI0004854997|nr:tetraacyldisaccharide 4'-kinase [Halonatronum saccharophilum]
MKLENYLIEVIEGKRSGLLAKLIIVILALGAYLYRAIIVLRTKLYDIGLKKSKKLQAKVISVGNITVGGTGKTPVVELLSRRLIKDGYKVLILNRGYKGGFSGQVGLVSNEKQIFMSAKEAGDEPYMMAKSLPGIPIIVGPNRLQTGQYAIDNFDPDFIILDDGFQHLQVKRDYDIVVIDATNPFDNEYLLPRGKLREPLVNLKRAHLFLLTKVDQVNENKLKEISKRLVGFNPAAPIIKTKHRPDYLRFLGETKRKDIDLKEESVFAFSGIGNPKSFEKTLESLGATVVGKLRFEDHHSYTKEEVIEIFTLASHSGAERIITTEKDAVSIDKELVDEIIQEKIPLEVLGIRVELLDDNYKFEELISRLEV